MILSKNNYFVPQVRTLFIMLGNHCNFNCGYCLQKPITHKPLKTEISEDFIECLIDLGTKNFTPLHIQFYGGEPLLYWESFVEIVNSLKDYRKYFYYSTITNGKLLTKDKVDFLNENEIVVTISWDGRNTELSRGQDVFKDPEFKENWLNLNRTGISSVVNKYAMPWTLCEDIDKLNEDYMKHNDGRCIHSNFDLVFDTGGLSDPKLLDCDYNQISLDVKKMCVEYDKNMIGIKGCSPTAINIIQALINQLEWGVEKELIFPKCSCSNGYEVLNMDTQGNLYYCHNGTDSYGNIKGDFWELLGKVMAWDNTVIKNERCKKCVVQSICHNGCPAAKIGMQDEEWDLTDSWCKIKRAYFYPVIEYVVNAGKSIKEESGK